MTEARLGFAIDSSQAVGASSDLDRLTASAGKAEQAANKVAIAATKASRGFGDIGPVLERIVAGIDQLNQTSTSISSKLDAMARAATGAARAAKGIGEAANDAGKNVDNLSDKLRKGGESARSFGDQASHVKAFRDEINRLAAKFAPVQTAAQKYEGAIGEIQRAHRLGVISAQQMTAELEKERAAFERLNAAANKTPGRAPSAANSNELSEGNRRFIGRDLGFQFQDIAVTAVGGMSPKAIALQQGTQIAGAVQGLTLKQTGAALAGALGGIFSVTSLAAIAFTGLAATAIQFFVNGTNKAKSLDDTLKSNAETLDLLKDRYGELAKVSASVTSVGGNSFVLSQARSQKTVIDATMRDQIGKYFGQVNDTSLLGGTFGLNGVSTVKALQNLRGDEKQFAGPVAALLDRVKSGQPGLEQFNDDVEDLYSKLILVSKNPEALRSTANNIEGLGDSAFKVTGKFKPFSDAINMLKVRGVDGLSDFTDQVHRIGEEKGLTKLADELISKGGDIVKLAQQAETLRRTLQAIDREDTRPGLRDRDALQGYVARRAVSLRQLNEQFDADQQQQGARTFAERLAAVERVSRAQRPSNADEGGGADGRAARAVQGERNRQERELRDAALSRSTALQSAISDQQQEISLVGKAGAEQASLRKEYELTSQIRLEAIRNGVDAEGKFREVYGKELESIKTLSAEYGRLVEARARASLSNDLSFQRDQLGRSPEQRRIADTLRGAGLPVDLLSKQAKDIADTNAALAGQRMGYAREGFNAQIAGINARTPVERIAAARAAAAAQHNDGETDPERAQRINDAEATARAQINRQQADADRDRSLSLRRLLEQQQQDIDLIGKTGAAAEAAKEQFQLLAELRQQAAQQGITSETDFQTVFAKQIEQIKEASAEYGKLVELRGRTQLGSDLDFQDRQLRRSARDQQVVTTLRQYGQPEDLNSPEANRIRSRLRNQEEKSAIDQFSNNLASNIVQSGGKIGKAFAQTFLSSLQEAAQKQLANIFSQLLTSVLMPNAGAGATTQAAVAGGAGSLASKIVGVANDNKASVAVPNTDVASYITQAAIKRGIDPSTALAVAKSEGGLKSWNMQSGVMKNGVQEPSFGPYQLYMGGGLGNAFQKQTGMNPADAASGPAGVDFALDYAKKNGWGSWYGAKNSGISNWQGIGANSNMNTAADAVNKLAENSQAAAANVGTFGTSLGQIGQSLSSNIFPSAPQSSGGGGLFGWLGSLFNSPFKPLGPQGAAAAAGKLKPGLFASGTNYAPGGPAIVGENGPELLDLPQGSQVTSNHKLMSALAANSNQAQPNRTLMVSVQGASGDDHVRTLVQQGVGAALSDYNTQQRRGGVGVLQARYSNQKV